jgi:hypothetical protein
MKTGRFFEVLAIREIPGTDGSLRFLKFLKYPELTVL